jgi:TonB family protein
MSRRRDRRRVRRVVVLATGLAAALALSAAAGAAPKDSPAALAKTCREELQAGHYGKAVAAADRWILLASSEGDRALANHHRGLALLRRGVDERYGKLASAEAVPAVAPLEAGSPARESLVGAASSLRLAVDVSDRDLRRVTLLSLAEALVHIGGYDEALAVLDEAAAGGGDDPLAAELRCWSGFMLERSRGILYVEHKPKSKQWTVERTGSGGLRGELRGPTRLAGAPAEPAEAARGEGTHLVAGLVDEQGRVVCARPLRPEPDGLAAAAVEALKKWQFKPAELGGVPVAVVYTTTVSGAPAP